MKPQHPAKQIISLVAPEVLAMPIEDNNEPLVDLINQNIILFGPSPEIPNNKDYTKIRQTVYEKLLAAQQILPSKLRLCIYEGYRSLQLQETLFNNRYKMLQGLYPTWSHEQLFQETTNLVSPRINLDGSINIPPHSTGGAIDIYLVNQEGDIVDMGIKAADWMKDVDGSIAQTDSVTISEDAQKHRSIMNTALQEIGFANYPGEYWHWSYGDRYWAYSTGHQFALYGTVT